MYGQEQAQAQKHGQEQARARMHRQQEWLRGQKQAVPGGEGKIGQSEEQPGLDKIEVSQGGLHGVGEGESDGAHVARQVQWGLLIQTSAAQAGGAWL
jgi:hypothetical protein